jgi:cell wall-associated NlpC family hydrolase
VRPVAEAAAQRQAIVAAARSALGTRFRPQGRTPGLGLDCVGLALVAARAAGVQPQSLPVYALNGEHGERLEAALRALGCHRVERRLPGDLLIAAPAPRHRHLAIVADGGIIHAHAGLGKVVEGPLDPHWTIIGCWRFPGVR